MDLVDQGRQIKTTVVVSVCGSLTRTFDTDEELSLVPHTDLELPITALDPEYSNLSLIGQRFVRSIEDKKYGVTNIHVTRFGADVTLGEAFEWALIEPVVLEAFAQAVGTEIDVRRESDYNRSGGVIIIDYDYLEEYEGPKVNTLGCDLYPDFTVGGEIDDLT